jgi:hypothetical protein
MSKMKRFLLVLMAVILTLSTSTALAGPPDEAVGEWSYIVTDFDLKVAGLNTFMTSYDNSVWTGTFDGVSTGVGLVVMHPSGKISVKGKEYFDGTVNGQSGTFELSLVGQCCDEQGHWMGQWFILSGTEGLANLRGEGTWFGPGAGGSKRG